MIRREFPIQASSQVPCISSCCSNSKPQYLSKGKSLAEPRDAHVAQAGHDCTQGKLSSLVLWLCISWGAVCSGQCSSCSLSGLSGNRSHLETVDFLLSEVKQKGKAQTEGARQMTFCGNRQLLSPSQAQPIQKLLN